MCLPQRIFVILLKKHLIWIIRAENSCFKVIKKCLNFFLKSYCTNPERNNVTTFDYFGHNTMVIVSVTTTGFLCVYITFSICLMFKLENLVEFECFSLDLDLDHSAVNANAWISQQRCAVTVSQDQHRFQSKPVLSSDLVCLLCAQLLIRADKRSTLHLSNE